MRNKGDLMSKTYTGKRQKERRGLRLDKMKRQRKEYFERLGKGIY